MHTTSRGPTPPGPLVAVAHPSADLYGSDLQLVESVRALTAAGWAVRVYLPQEGALSPVLRQAGARVEVHPFPVLRRSALSAAGLARYAVDAARAHRAIRAHLTATRPDVVLVNTLTIPPWLTAARRCAVPAVCHVHEAEETAGRPVRTALALPTTLASVLVVNSQASLAALADVVPAVRSRARVVYNGVAGPPADGATLGPSGPPGSGAGPSLVVVGRLSPRKGTDVALDAVALLVGRGHDVRLDVCGSAFSGYEWFEQQLRERAARTDLAGRVTFHGYARPWPYLARARVALVPSRQEPFGNTAVEAMLAGCPVVASAVQGLGEIVEDGVDGLLVPPGDAVALADAVAGLLDDPARADRLGAVGAGRARARFSTERYARDIVAAVESAARLRTRR